jgi:tRNA-dihydrouridine synthase
MYSGKADWTLIGVIRKDSEITLPIIGNGDIVDPIQAKEHFETYLVDGIMIGRGSIGRPWIFKHIRHYLDTGELLPEPTLSEKIEIARMHLLRSVEDKGEYGGILTMRRHYVHYFKGIEHSREWRIKLLTSNSLKENLDLLDKLKNRI